MTVRTYQATGIVLKGMPLGEADRLVTILTREYGLIRAVVPGARKLKSSLRGRCELFVVNQLQIAKGQNLDKIIQAETRESYPGLSRDLGKLTGSQYLAELCLGLALSEQPQGEIYDLLLEHLSRLERLEDGEAFFAYLAQSVFHILAISGIGPRVQECCWSNQKPQPDYHNTQWQVGFSFEAGGIMILNEACRQEFPPIAINRTLGALELTVLQNLSQATLPQFSEIIPPSLIGYPLKRAWANVEHLLRDYAQYHLGYSLRSATLIDRLTSVDF
jgi:DNA repair protein RecO (recombination protein O)